MSENRVIKSVSNDISTNIALDTFSLGKQILIFVNSKRSAESQAEKIYNALGRDDPVNSEILHKYADQILGSASSATKQCVRLAKCVRRGSAFHHAGLHPKQREIVEQGFLAGHIKTISATPTLAAGVNLPAFRCLIRDLKRYTPQGNRYIAVLEYHQMTGRAGRPDFNDKFGEAITIAKVESEKDIIYEKFITAPPEDIVSKLAVEPVLRTYVLSLISTELVNDWKSLMDFFSRTFYAHEYGNINSLSAVMLKIINYLEEWGFIIKDGNVVEKEKGLFSSAIELVKGSVDGNFKISATPIGIRVSELYLDPYTAHHFLNSIKNANNDNFSLFSILHMICFTLEMRPLLRVKQSEVDSYIGISSEYDGKLVVKEPDVYDEAFDRFLNAIKTSRMLEEWCEETTEELLLERYDVRPGELRYKLDVADWLLYSCEELSRLVKFHTQRSVFRNVRTRLKYGARDELLPLLKLKGVGRIKARKLFANSIKDLGDLKKCDMTTLVQLMGKLSVSLKKQVGVDVSNVIIKPNKRKGQVSLNDFR